MHGIRILRIPLRYGAFVLFLTITDFSFAFSQSEAITPKGQARPLEDLSAYENYTMLHPDLAWVITVSSTNPKSGKPKSEIHLYHFDGVRWKQVSAISVPETYNARAEMRRDMQYQGHPIAVIRFQHGAEAETLQVYALLESTLKPIQTLNAGAFEWSYEKAGKSAGKVTLSAIPGGAVDPVTTFIWDGSKFTVLDPTNRK